MGKEDINLKYLAQYLIETEQNIESFNEMLVVYEKEKNNPSLINDLFRVIHTIKGTSGIVNVGDVQKIAHRMENILSYIRETKKYPDDLLISLLFSGIDAITEIIILLKENKTGVVSIQGICEELDTAYQQLTAPASSEAKPAEIPEKPAVDVQPEKKESPKEPEPSSCQADLLDIESLPEPVQKQIQDALAKELDLFKICLLVEEKPMMRGMKALLVKERLQRHGIIAFMNPTIETVDENKEEGAPLGFIFCGCSNEKDIRSSVSVSGVKIQSIERIDKTRLQKYFREEMFPKQKICDIIATDMGGGGMNNEEQKAESSVVSSRHMMELSTIRIDSNKLDNLMNLSGELVIIRARFAQLVSLLNNLNATHKELVHSINDFASQNETLQQDLRAYIVGGRDDKENNIKKIMKTHSGFATSIGQLHDRFTKNSINTLVHSLDEVTTALGKISSDIQTGVMQARMVPVEGVFARFKRIVRDLSKELGKEVELIIEGEDTELDKKIVDSLGDPLTHLIRNSIDHGIEDKETRRKLGKPEIGNIYLRASHKGSHIWIEVSDDGRGVDVNKIAQTALKKKMYDQSQLEKMSEKEKINLIFLPGFSTADKVTDLSGRGVGLDVVRNMVTSVNGSIDIDTHLSKGTTFILKIPLTLAIIQALLVMIGDVTYAFPLETVIEIVKVSQEEVYSIDGVDTVKLRDHTLNLIELEEVIRVQGKSRKNQPYKTVVIITDGEEKIGVIIDALIGEDEIVIKSLSEHFSRVIGIAGASILGDGTIALILDPLSIIKEAR